jgi:hypothetical protein
MQMITGPRVGLTHLSRALQADSGIGGVFAARRCLLILTLVTPRPPGLPRLATPAILRGSPTPAVRARSVVALAKVLGLAPQGDHQHTARH